MAALDHEEGSVPDAALFDHVQQARQTLFAQRPVTKQRSAAFAANKPALVFGGHGGYVQKRWFQRQNPRENPLQLRLRSDEVPVKRGGRIMKLSVPMLADAICEYHQKEEVEEDFDKFVLKKFKMNEVGGVQVLFRKGDNQLLVRANGVGSDGMLWECEFSLKIERVYEL
jgi:hypothetical protein